MLLSLGFSPCPNDCFMFDAIVNRRIDLGGLSFETHLDDVEALNRRAFAGTADVTKLSYHAYAYCRPDYVLLDSGSALGRSATRRPWLAAPAAVYRVIDRTRVTS